MTQYAVIIEKGDTGAYGAYVPDLPGCIAVGGSADEVKQLIRKGIELYLDELQQRGRAVPQPTSEIEYVAFG